MYYTLLALGGAVLIGLTFGVLQIVGADPEPVLADWILPFAMPGALVAAAWLVEAKQNVVENIAPVLTRVFTPLTIAMLLAILAVLAAAGGLIGIDRNLLILMDAILVLVLCMLLYSISARDSLAPPGLSDALQLVLVVAALAVGFLRGQRRFTALERWQTWCLPVYGAWAASVVVVFPPVFGFA